MKKTLIWSFATGMMFLVTMSFAAAPNIPTSGWATKFEKNNLTFMWDTWGGDNADTAELLINDTLKATQVPTDRAKGEAGQTGTFNVKVPENYISVVVVLKNADGSAKSEPKTFGEAPIPVIDLSTDSITAEAGVKSVKNFKISGGTKPYYYFLTVKPSDGEVDIADGKISYTPNKDVVIGKTDTFTFHAVDSKNEKSDSKSIDITFREPDGLSGDIEFYRDNVENFRTLDPNTLEEEHNWFKYWAPRISKSQENSMETLKYYARVNSLKDGKPYDLSKITTTVDEVNNPPNVNRIIKLMPKKAFETMFENSTLMTENRNGFVPGKTFSYINFLKAAAVVPAYCGDYADYPEDMKTEDMKTDEGLDRIAKKFLATTFAHAVQETSQSGFEGCTFIDKIPGTFDTVKEDHTPDMPDKGNSPFTETGKLHYLTEGNKYYGRGAKQLSYPSNYASVSLLLYGDLRLVKFPQLIEEENCLGFLTAIVYTVLPKTSYPSMAEVMDGTWSKKLNASGAPEEFLKTYDRDFALTVLIVNGGPECNGNPDNIPNTKCRIDAYNFFSTAVEPRKINDKDRGPLLNANVTYDVDTSEGYDSGQKLMVGTINAPTAPEAWKKLFVRDYYYNGQKLQYSDNGIQIFGGEAVGTKIKF